MQEASFHPYGWLVHDDTDLSMCVYVVSGHLLALVFL